MKRHSELLDIESIHKLVRSPDEKAEIEGHLVKVNSVRLKTFSTKGTDCVCCGVKGVGYYLESSNGDKPHLNLFAIDSNGEEILMTRDHIIPRSKNGPDTLANMLPMCVSCNSLRGSVSLERFLHDYSQGIVDKLYKNKGSGKSPRWDYLSKLVESDRDNIVLSILDTSIGLEGLKALKEVLKDKGDEIGVTVVNYCLRSKLQYIETVDYCNTLMKVNKYSYENLISECHNHSANFSEELQDMLNASFT